MTPVLLAKRASIERCIRQVQRYYALPSDLPFSQDHLRQDAIGLNLQRAADLAIDVANHCIKHAKLGLPDDTASTFQLLLEEGAISAETCRKMKGMVGFRNVLVHSYRELDLAVMVDVIENRLPDLTDFVAEVSDWLGV